MADDEISVLIIDDDREDARVSAIALRNAGSQRYRMHHADSLTSAFEALSTMSFDVALLDLGLPGTSGIETLEQFREHEEALPVVVLSGLEDEEIAMKTLECDAQDYVCKNEVNAKTLCRAIRHSIQRASCVTEIKRLLVREREKEEILRRKNERLKSLYETAHTFVDNVSHEFRTPLTVIKEYVSLVADGTMGDINEEQQRFLTIVEDRANDLNTMVDDMLDVSKLEAGLLSVCRRPHYVHDIVQRVSPSLQRKAAVKDLTLKIDSADNLPQVYCDAEKVERVLINLAVNAMKFTRPGGRVEIAAEAEAENVKLSVSDTGQGIAPDNLKAIFERFEQVDISVRSSTKGFGLGLSIAKELVDLNFGKLTVASEQGAGSTFSFTVPRWTPAGVAQRYLQLLEMKGCNTLSLLIAEIPAAATSADTHETDMFLRYLVRATDLVFRAEPHRWLLLLPEPASEAHQFIVRAQDELDATNRNRPRGPLPSVSLDLHASWSPLVGAESEVIDTVQALLQAAAESNTGHELGAEILM